MKQVLKYGAAIIGVGTFALLLASFAGALHPVGDSLAVFRVWFALLTVVFTAFCVLWKWRGLALFSGLAAVTGLVTLAPMLPFQSDPSGRYALYQKNMLFRNPDPTRIGQDILTRRPDFATLQEVSQQNEIILGILSNDYPAQNFCPFGAVGGVAVASRWPLVAGTKFCADHDGMAGMQVDTPDGPVWLISVHLHWPWPHSQAEHGARLRDILADLQGAKVIAGDFNMVPWSHQIRQFEKTSQTARIGQAFISLIKFNGVLRVPIDHVLTSQGQGVTQRLPLLGSDHFGVLAVFDL